MDTIFYKDLGLVIGHILRKLPTFFMYLISFLIIHSK